MMESLFSLYNVLENKKIEINNLTIIVFKETHLNYIMDNQTFLYILSKQTEWAKIHLENTIKYKYDKGVIEKQRVKDRKALLPSVPKKLGRPKLYY